MQAGPCPIFETTFFFFFFFPCSLPFITNPHPQRDRKRKRYTIASLFSYAFTFEHQKTKNKRGVGRGVHGLSSHIHGHDKRRVCCTLCHPSAILPSFARSLSSYRQTHAPPLSFSFVCSSCVVFIAYIGHCPYCLESRQIVPTGENGSSCWKTYWLCFLWNKMLCCHCLLIECLVFLRIINISFAPGYLLSAFSFLYIHRSSRTHAFYIPLSS